MIAARLKALYKPPQNLFQPLLTNNLRISWGYLLGPLFGHYLPAFIPKLLGMPTEITPVTSTTWTGVPMFHDPQTFHTCMEIINIDSDTLNNALVLCRRHNAKLTAFMHQAILAALRKHLPENDFVSQTPIDLRKFVPGTQDNEMGCFASTTFILHQARPTTTQPQRRVQQPNACRITNDSPARQERNNHRPARRSAPLYTQHAFLDIRPARQRPRYVLRTEQYHVFRFHYSRE